MVSGSYSTICFPNVSRRVLLNYLFLFSGLGVAATAAVANANKGHHHHQQQANHNRDQNPATPTMWDHLAGHQLHQKHAQRHRNQRPATILGVFRLSRTVIWVIHKKQWHQCQVRSHTIFLCLKGIFTKAEFLGVIGTKVLGVFLLAIHSHLYERILLPPPPTQAKVVWNWFLL